MFNAITRSGKLAALVLILANGLPLVLADMALTGKNSLASDATQLRSDHQTGMLCKQPDSRTLGAIVPVATDHGSRASGVVFDDNRVLTAAHAIQGGGNFFVRVANGYRRADLIMVDHHSDLAVLAVNTQSIEPLRISGFKPVEAEPVWAVGYPHAQNMSTSMGVFQRNREGALHSSASIDPGQSGGGLLSCHDGSWSMLGMLRGFGAYWQGDHYVKMKNHSVSVAAATINEFLLTDQ